MCYSIAHLKSLRDQAIDHGFSFPAGFKRRSYKRLQNSYNGIGAEWMWKPLRRLLTWCLHDLEPAALVHDYEWSMQKKSYWHFLVSNLRFLYNSTKMWHFLAGVIGALLCWLFGWHAYKKGKEKESK